MFNKIIFAAIFTIIWAAQSPLIRAAAPVQTIAGDRAGTLEYQDYAPEKLREDFAVFKKTLTALHPGIYRYQTPASMEKIFDEYASKLDRPFSEGEFFLLISEVANRLYCGHTFLNPYNQDQLVRERLFGGKTYLPFYFRIVDGRMIVTENASSRSLAKGSEIAAINGHPAKKIIERLLTVTKGDGRNVTAHRVQSIELTRFEAESYALFDWYFPLFFPLKNKKFAIEAVDFKTKKKKRLEVDALTKTERTAEMEKRYGSPPTYDDGWRFEIRDNSTGYLKIENSITWRLKNVKFKEFLAAAFADLRAKNVRNLIIDLRGNGGGDTTVGFELAKYLARKELPEYSKSRRLVRSVVPQKELAGYLDTYSGELKAVLQNGIPKDFYRKAENDYFEILPAAGGDGFPRVVPYEKNFQGRAFIIADASNASATFQFVRYAQENDLGTIVGQPTGGSKQGINGGNYFFLRLPNSKIEIDVPVFFLSPPSAQKDESVIPDVLVKRSPADTGNDLDREILTIEKMISEKSL